MRNKTILLLLFAAACFGQLNSFTKTTLSSAISNSIAPTPGVMSTVVLASCTNVNAPSGTQAGSMLFIDHEAMQVVSLPTTSPCAPRVSRGAFGTAVNGHAASSLVWVGAPDWYSQQQVAQTPAGTCTVSQQIALPRIHVLDGSWVTCDSLGLWGYAGPSRGSGFLRGAIKTVADAAYTALIEDYEIDYTTLTSTRLVTLPAATQLPGKVYVVKDSGGNATSMIKINLATVDGSATFACVAVAYGSCEVRSNGTTWGAIQ